MGGKEIYRETPNVPLYVQFARCSSDVYNIDRDVDNVGDCGGDLNNCSICVNNFRINIFQFFFEYSYNIFLMEKSNIFPLSFKYCFKSVFQ